MKDAKDANPNVFFLSASPVEGPIAPRPPSPCLPQDFQITMVIPESSISMATLGQLRLMILLTYGPYTSPQPAFSRFSILPHNYHIFLTFQSGSDSTKSFGYGNVFNPHLLILHPHFIVNPESLDYLLLSPTDLGLLEDIATLIHGNRSFPTEIHIPEKCLHDQWPYSVDMDKPFIVHPSWNFSLSLQFIGKT